MLNARRADREHDSMEQGKAETSWSIPVDRYAELKRAVFGTSKNSKKNPKSMLFIDNLKLFTNIS